MLKIINSFFSRLKLEGSFIQLIFECDKFISSTLDKMKNIVEMKGSKNITIAVDGGVNLKTISKIYETGIDVTIVGSGLFEAKNLSQRYKDLLDA